MKKIIMTLIIALGVSQAQAGKGPLILDMTGKNFRNNSLNLMDDGIDWGRYNGYAMKLQGRYGSDFTVIVKGSASHVKCSIVKTQYAAGVTYLLLSANVETDSGEACYYSVNYRIGGKATLQIYEEGT